MSFVDVEYGGGGTPINPTYVTEGDVPTASKAYPSVTTTNKYIITVCLNLAGTDSRSFHFVGYINNGEMEIVLASTVNISVYYDSLNRLVVDNANTTYRAKYCIIQLD